MPNRSTALKIGTAVFAAVFSLYFGACSPSDNRKNNPDNTTTTQQTTQETGIPETDASANATIEAKIEEPAATEESNAVAAAEIATSETPISTSETAASTGEARVMSTDDMIDFASRCANFGQFMQARDYYKQALAREPDNKKAIAGLENVILDIDLRGLMDWTKTDLPPYEVLMIIKARTNSKVKKYNEAIDACSFLPEGEKEMLDKCIYDIHVKWAMDLKEEKEYAASINHLIFAMRYAGEKNRRKSSQIKELEKEIAVIRILRGTSRNANNLEMLDLAIKDYLSASDYLGLDASMKDITGQDYRLRDIIAEAYAAKGKLYIIEGDMREARRQYRLASGIGRDRGWMEVYEKVMVEVLKEKASKE